MRPAGSAWAAGAAHDARRRLLAELGIDAEKAVLVSDGLPDAFVIAPQVLTAREVELTA